MFKLSAGVLALAAFAPAGYARLALGAIDLALNLVNLAALLVAQRRVSGVCLAELLLRGRPDLGLALDGFVSFGLVAVLIGFGLLRHLPLAALRR